MILLDTHVLVWWQREPRKLSKTAASSIRRALASDSIAISAITVVKLAALINRGRIRTTGTLEGTLRAITSGVRVLPVTLEIGVLTGLLSTDSVLDPMDRIIAATAQSEAIPLVTADHRILACRWLKTIWQ